MEEIRALVGKLNHYRDRYYNDSVSEISDYEYDRLYDKLSELEKTTGFVMSNSPTQTVGYEVKSHLTKVTHSHPMLSLSKTKDINELRKFANEKPCVISLKMDGLTVLLTYEDGKLIRGETRGNGEIGEDITHNVRVFENVPLTIPVKEHIEIKGEAIITYEDFEKINSGSQKYKNPRNLVSGSVRQLDNSIAKDRHIKFVAWEFVNEEEDFWEGLQDVYDLGFDTVPCFLTEGYIEEDLIDALKHLAEEKSYPIDGLVLTYNDVAYGKSLGLTGHHPRHSMAYKFYDEEIETTITDIEWTMGKTGVLTPTAVFDPVDIDGTIVERASVHNVSVLTDLDLRIGDTVTVYKANMIIPQIATNISANGRRDGYVKIIGNCPICGSPTKIKQENSSKILVCTNKDCKGKLLGKLSHFVSREAINIDGLSKATLEFLIEKGWVTSFKDLYHLDDHKETWSKISGFGTKSVTKILNAINESRNTDLVRYLYSLSIPQVGRTASKKICEICDGDYEYFINHIGEVRNTITNTPGYGSAISYAIGDFFKENIDMVKELAQEFNFSSKEFMNAPISGKLAGLTFVVTGSVNIFKNRKELQKIIEDNGGKVASAVSKNVNYLINNDLESTSSKNRKAKELGIAIISEKDFNKMLDL